ncbi:MAG: DUF4852 domain-containing protein [Alphaproteobacteria bacterium]|nr:DUF4852 domain-containing protein [Alphaproteobacteria bacterium]
MILLRFAFLVVLGLVSLPSSALADDYIEPSRANLIRTMIRFGAVDLGDENLLDDYARITECDIYSQFYSNDFKWNEVRQAIRKSVQLNVATFPVTFYYDIKLPLGRYDFNAKMFRFSAKDAVDGVNIITLTSLSSGCNDSDAVYLPRIFRAYLTSTIYTDGLPMPEAEAKALLKRMNESGTREIYARYNLRIVYVEPLVKFDGRGRRREASYSQTDQKHVDEANLSARLDSIAYYEDHEHTKLLGLVKP